MKKAKILLMVIVGVCLLISRNGFSQEAQLTQKALTHEEFALEIVKLMKLEYLLPPAPLPKDAVALLESLGISPLTGWRPEKMVSEEEYLTVLGQAQGKESLVHQRAVEVEKRNIQIINEQWQQAYQKTGRWLSLQELLDSREYFPQGAPKSPYGQTYQDHDGDHRVDFFFSPAATLVQLRDILTTR